MKMCSQLTELTVNPIDVEFLLRFISHPHAGGEAIFVGTTRAWTANRRNPSPPGHETEYLVYEAHEPLARQQLLDIAQKAAVTWPVLRVAIVHRLGKVLPMEASLAIAVSTAHRADAFEATRWIIEEVKKDVAIWKQEHVVGVGPQWIHPDEDTCCSSPPTAP